MLSYIKRGVWKVTNKIRLENIDSQPVYQKQDSVNFLVPHFFCSHNCQPSEKHNIFISPDFQAVHYFQSDLTFTSSGTPLYWPTESTVNRVRWQHEMGRWTLPVQALVQCRARIEALIWTLMLLCSGFVAHHFGQLITKVGRGLVGACELNCRFLSTITVVHGCRWHCAASLWFQHQWLIVRFRHSWKFRGNYQ